MKVTTLLRNKSIRVWRHVLDRISRIPASLSIQVHLIHIPDKWKLRASIWKLHLFANWFKRRTREAIIWSLLPSQSTEMKPLNNSQRQTVHSCERSMEAKHSITDIIHWNSDKGNSEADEFHFKRRKRKRNQCIQDNAPKLLILQLFSGVNSQLVIQTLIALFKANHKR